MEKRITSVALIAVLLFAAAVAFAQPFGYRANENQNARYDGSGMMGTRGGMMGANGFGCPMMQGAYQDAEIETASGTVAEIEQHEIVLDTNKEIHAPFWFIAELGVKEGDTVTAKGVYVRMHGDEELMPFELTVNGKTYGSAEERIPVWIQ